MEHFRLIVFRTVYSLRSYTEAARELGISQPAVSQNIAELEKEIGTPLFVRGTAGSGNTGVSGGEGSADVANFSADSSAAGVANFSAGSSAAKDSAGGLLKGGKMVPTPAAELFRAMAERVLRGYEDIGVMFSPEAASYEVVRIRADRSASEYVFPRVTDILHAAHPNIRFEVLSPADAGADLAYASSEAAETSADAGTPMAYAAEGTAQEPAAPADVTITTVPVRQGGSLTLRFEVHGPAVPFVRAVRLILTEFCV